jgi:hypothetical protein
VIWTAWAARQRTPDKLDGQRLPIEQFHGQEQLAVLFTDFVELAHMRMVEARRRSGLAPGGRVRPSRPRTVACRRASRRA